MKKILITGANGFIGSTIVNFFANDENYKISVLVRKTSNLQRLQNVIDKINIFYGDIREKNSLSEPLKDADLIIHCAAVLRCIKNDTYYEVNHYGTKNLVETIIENNYKIQGLIYLSSQAASGPSNCLDYKKSESYCEPVSDYGKSKFLAEQEILKYKDKIKSIILRPAAVYGPYDKDMFLYFKLAEKGLLPVFNKEFCIQFIYIYDLVKVVKNMILNFERFNSKIFFVAEDRSYNVEGIKNIFEKVFNKKIKVIFIPYFVGYIYAYINENFYKFFYKQPAIFNRDKLKELSKNYWLCNSKDIKSVIPEFSYTPLEIGVKETYKWYKENGWL
ncbi:MAG: NAD-dependent epimerase/dehydratase family protein [Endomicrobiia bacterium]